MSKQNVNLRISNKQYSESLIPKGEAFSRELNLEDEIEIFVEGTLYKKDNSTYITYEEAQDGDYPANRTVIKLEGETISIRRYGDEDLDLPDFTLQEGILNITRMRAPMGRLDLEIYTNAISDELSEEGYGMIRADYNVRFDEYMSARNKLEIEVQPS